MSSIFKPHKNFDGYEMHHSSYHQDKLDRIDLVIARTVVIPEFEGNLTMYGDKCGNVMQKIRQDNEYAKPAAGHSVESLYHRGCKPRKTLWQRIKSIFKVPSTH